MFPVGDYGLSTLHARQHWHSDLFRIARKDGVVKRFTSTEGRQEFRGEIYLPTPGERRDEAIEAQLSAGDSELRGLVGIGGISSIDIQQRRYIDALVQHFLVDWRRGKLYLEQDFYVENIEQDGNRWRAVLLSLARELRQYRGPVHHSLCPAILGDARCQAVFSTEPVTVSTVHDVNLEFTCTGAIATTNRYALGHVLWTTGNNKGTSCRIFGNSSGGRIALGVPTRLLIRVGDTGVLTPGCDGLATTCKNTYDNLLNHRGNERARSAKQLILARGTVN